MHRWIPSKSSSDLRSAMMEPAGVRDRAGQSGGVLQANTGRVKTAHQITSLTLLLPRCGLCPKHGREAHVNNEGEVTSPMPLRENQTQMLLLISLKDAHGRRAYNKARPKWYRF